MFQGSHAYFGALNIASMIPLSTRQLADTPIVSTCKTMLRNLTLESPANEYQSLIHTLCTWDRGGEVIELAIYWIEDAFRLQSLNESAVSSCILLAIYL